VITRALGPEGTVEVDTRSYSARDADIYLLCSDGLTTMVPEDLLATILGTPGTLRELGEALIVAANEAGGRDNITVVLLRIEELDASSSPLTEEAVLPAQAQGSAPEPQGAVVAGSTATATAAPSAVVRRRPRRPSAQGKQSRRGGRRLRRAGGLAVLLAVLAVIGGGAWIALQSVYFIGTNERGLVTMYRGVPYRLPGDVALYSSDYISGVAASTLAPQRQRTLLDHSLRSEGNAGALVHSLELGQVE
jgi:PPM family protein phosphatase